MRLLHLFPALVVPVHCDAVAFFEDDGSVVASELEEFTEFDSWDAPEGGLQTRQAS